MLHTGGARAAPSGVVPLPPSRGKSAYPARRPPLAACLPAYAYTYTYTYTSLLPLPIHLPLPITYTYRSAAAAAAVSRVVPLPRIKTFSDRKSVFMQVA